VARYWQKLRIFPTQALFNAFVEEIPLELCNAILDFIGTKDDGSGGDNCSYQDVQSPIQIITTNIPAPNFLQAGCPSYRPTNSVKALKGIYHGRDYGLYM